MPIEYVLFKSIDRLGVKRIGSYAIVTAPERISDIATREEPVFNPEGDFLNIALSYAADIARSTDTDREQVYQRGDSVSTIPSIRRFCGGIKHLPVDELVLKEFEEVLEAQSIVRLSKAFVKI
jgi:hypothetical protein